jgi:hypothetical protein
LFEVLGLERKPREVTPAVLGHYLDDAKTENSEAP